MVIRMGQCVADQPIANAWAKPHESGTATCILIDAREDSTTAVTVTSSLIVGAVNTVRNTPASFVTPRYWLPPRWRASRLPTCLSPT